MYIFNFHHVEPQPLKHPSRQHITITPDGLAQFIRIIRRLGMTPVSIRNVVKAGGPQAMQPSDALLTFDDGYENNLQYALPVLEAEKCPATVFVLPGRFSGTNTWDQGNLPEEQRDRLISLEQMRTLADSPYVDLGSHGMLHRNFAQLNREELAHEINSSYEILSQELGDNFVPVLAYPWGAYSQLALEVVAKSPYRYAFTTKKHAWTSQDSRFEVPRFTVYYRDGNPLILLAKLAKIRLLRSQAPSHSPVVGQ